MGEKDVASLNLLYSSKKTLVVNEGVENTFLKSR